MPVRARTATGGLALLVSAALVGCGSTSSGDRADVDAVRAAAIAYARATMDVDLDRACALVTGLDEPVRSAGAAPAPCPSVLANGANGSVRPTDRDLRRLRDATIVVDGDRARIELVGTEMPLRRVDGAWKVDFAAMRPGDVG
ncbi:MAG: hypothetical protein M0P31_11770 [Solirubrobacteraceae bacterium]|nr:hypothetical protein [Solirubrobacteraceae bacterium]